MAVRVQKLCQICLTLIAADDPNVEFPSHSSIPPIDLSYSDGVRMVLTAICVILTEREKESLIYSYKL